mgnify:CR=1 FL=1
MNRQDQDNKLDQWLKRHRGLLLKVARSFASESNDRDDLFQEIVLQVWRSVPRHNNEVAESTWIYRVALYTAISWSRKETKRREKSRELEREGVSDETDADPRVEWLYQQIAELAPIDRSLTLLMLDGFSYREMSATLGMTESNVGVRINRIKTQLSNALEQEDRHEF